MLRRSRRPANPHPRSLCAIRLSAFAAEPGVVPRPAAKPRSHGHLRNRALAGQTL